MRNNVFSYLCYATSVMRLSLSVILAHHRPFRRLYNSLRLGFFWSFQETVKQTAIRVSAVRSLQPLAWWPGWGTQRVNWARWRTNRWLLLFMKPTRASRRAKRWGKPWMIMLLLSFHKNKSLHSVKHTGAQGSVCFKGFCERIRDLAYNLLYVVPN